MSAGARQRVRSRDPGWAWAGGGGIRSRVPSPQQPGREPGIPLPPSRAFRPGSDPRLPGARGLSSSWPQGCVASLSVLLSLTLLGVPGAEEPGGLGSDPSSPPAPPPRRDSMRALGMEGGDSSDVPPARRAGEAEVEGPKDGMSPSLQRRCSGSPMKMSVHFILP